MFLALMLILFVVLAGSLRNICGSFFEGITERHCFLLKAFVSTRVPALVHHVLVSIPNIW